MKIDFVPVSISERKRFLVDEDNWEITPNPMRDDTEECLKKTYALRTKAAMWLTEKIKAYDGMHPLLFDRLPEFNEMQVHSFSCADVMEEANRNHLVANLDTHELLELIEDSKGVIGKTWWDVYGSGMRGWRVEADYAVGMPGHGSWVSYTVYNYIRGMDMPSAIADWGMRVHSDGSVVMREYNRHRGVVNNLQAAELSGYVQLLAALHERARINMPYKAAFQGLDLDISIRE